MELKEYVEVVKKNILIIFLLTFLGGAVALYFATNFKSGYRLEQDFFISSSRETSSLASPQQALTDSPQNSYYSQEYARNFTDTAVAILASPDFAGSLNTPGSIAIRKEAPQVIKITTIASDPQLAKSLMEKVTSIFNGKIRELQPSTTFQINAIGKVSEPRQANPPPKIVLAFGAAAGFVTSLAVIGLKTYFRL
jgi:capsular polysaccharide biosynthesis protein